MAHEAPPTAPPGPAAPAGPSPRVEVLPAASRRDVRRFVDLQVRLRRGDPGFVAPLRIGELERFDRRKNPFLEHARIEPFLAWRDGRAVGRIAVIDDDLHNRIHGDDLAFFGFFEAEDAEVAAALFRRAEERARELGRRTLRGPANPSMNDGSGFQIDAFGTKPYIMMPQNPPEHPAWAEAAGFVKVKDLYAWRIDLEGDAMARLERLAERVRRRIPGLRIRPADMRALDRELATLKRVYNGEWERNWGFVPYTDAEFDHLAKDLKMIVRPEIALFAEMEGEAVGVAIALPDLNRVLERFDGRLLPFGIWHLLRRDRIVDRARLPILGVVGRYRGKGIELAMIDEIAKQGRRLGYREGECSWILEDNDAMNRGIEAAGAVRSKTYRLFEKPL